jgi:hypothetical protein
MRISPCVYAVSVASWRDHQVHRKQPSGPSRMSVKSMADSAVAIRVVSGVLSVNLCLYCVCFGPASTALDNCCNRILRCSICCMLRIMLGAAVMRLPLILLFWSQCIMGNKQLNFLLRT